MTRLKKKLVLPQTKGYSFDKENHVHTLDGEALTGVTTILGVINKPMLIQWSANQAIEYIRQALKEGKDIDEIVLKEASVAHRKKKEAAGEAGTDVHAEIEKIIKYAIEGGGYIVGKNDAENGQVKNFIDWAMNNKVKFIESERNLYSINMFVGGIADIVCEIDGKRFVGDIKTSSGIYPEHFIQASAYAEMAKEMGLYEHFDGVVIINLKKTGEIDVKADRDVAGNFEAFKAALTLYRYLQAIKNAK